MIERELEILPGGESRAAEAAKRGMRFLVQLAGLVCLAYAVSIIVTRMDTYFVTLAAVGVVAAIILSRKFEFGLLAYFLIAPFNTGHSPAVLGAEASYNAGVMPSEVGLILLTFFWGASQALGRGLTLISTRLNTALIAFFVVAGLSVLSAQFIWDADVQRSDKQLLFQISEVGIWGLCAMAFLLTANSIRDRSWVSAFYWPVVLVALYVSYFGFTNLEMPLRISHSMFIVAFAASLTAARLVFRRDVVAMKVLLGLLLALFLAAAFYNRSWVSGWVTTGLGVMIVASLYSRKALVALVVVILLVLVIHPDYIRAVYSESHQEGDMDRINMWVDSTSMAVSTNPILGIGPGDYMAYGRKYGSDWYGTNTYTTPHSNYAQMIAEMGLLGIAAFIFLVVAGVRTGLDAFRRTRSDLKWFAAGATAIFASIAVSSLVGDYLLPSRVNGGIWSFSTSVYPWLLLGASAALARIDGDQEDDEE